MPITVQVPEGAFTEKALQDIFAGLTTSVLKINGVLGNPFSHRHLIGDVLTVPKGHCFADGKPTDYVNVTFRVPVFAMLEDSQREQLTHEITKIVVVASEGRIEEGRVYINMIYGDGFWGVGGTFYTNDTLKDEIMRNQPMAS